MWIALLCVAVVALIALLVAIDASSSINAVWRKVNELESKLSRLEQPSMPTDEHSFDRMKTQVRNSRTGENL